MTRPRKLKNNVQYLAYCLQQYDYVLQERTMFVNGKTSYGVYKNEYLVCILHDVQHVAMFMFGVYSANGNASQVIEELELY